MRLPDDVGMLLQPFFCHTDCLQSPGKEIQYELNRQLIVKKEHQQDATI